MKRLPFITAISLVFALVACQKDKPQELEAIMEHQVLQEDIQRLATMESVEIQNIFADKRTPTCTGISFEDALASFKEANQREADETCLTVKGSIEGCYEGYTTYGTALVFPTPNNCGGSKSIKLANGAETQ